MLASYTWSHAIDNVDPGFPSQNPNDPNFTGKIENGNAIFDQRQRFVLSGVYIAPFKIHSAALPRWPPACLTTTPPARPTAATPARRRTVR